MSKKKQTKATKSKQAGAAKPTRRLTCEQAHTVTAPAAGSEGAPPEGPPRERVRDPRLPPSGTVIEKRDRAGNVRCKCTVEEDGIHYDGKVYRSLSGAAMAAARDLGKPTRSINGWVFWGITKVRRPAGNPLEALGRAWDRYRERATSVVGAVTDENREQVRDTIEKHAESIAELRGRIAP